MPIQDHYLWEDFNLLTDHLENLHKHTMKILECATTANFQNVDEHQKQIQKSLQVLLALHNKKLKQDEFALLNNGVYARRGWVK